MLIFLFNQETLFTCLCNIFNKPIVKPVSVFCVATGISRPNLFKKTKHIYLRLFFLRSLTGGVSPFANARKYLSLNKIIIQKKKNSKNKIKFTQHSMLIYLQVVFELLLQKIEVKYLEIQMEQEFVHAYSMVHQSPYFSRMNTIRCKYSNRFLPLISCHN